MKCGADGLPASAVHEECPNPGGMTQGEALITAIEED
jgi:hypothetical protein